LFISSSLPRDIGGLQNFITLFKENFNINVIQMLEVLVPLFLGLFLAWNLGANDLANAMSTSVGSGALRVRKATLLASFFQLFGALTFGGAVMGTIGMKMVPQEVMSVEVICIVLLSTSLWIFYATYKRVPISLSHSLIGSLIGVGIGAGMNLNLGLTVEIILSWILSPFISLFIAALVYLGIRNLLYTRMRGVRERRRIERMFALLQVLSASLFCFGAGANSVPKAVGILVGLDFNPDLLMVIGAVGVAIGVLTWGGRVMKTVGRGIFRLTPMKGFCSQFSSAIVVILFTFLAIPVSTTHILIGAILGIGMVSSEKIRWRTVREITTTWVFTVPITALTSMILVCII